MDISIHAPTWGATFFREKIWMNLLFQSTHPRGVRPISMPMSMSPANFNPRTHVGCDAHPEHSSAHDSDFNPRTHVGCDGVLILLKSAILYFNPRTHVGCDAAGARARRLLTISIHAPTWGATDGHGAADVGGAISIHAPTWGATAEEWK